MDQSIKYRPKPLYIPPSPDTYPPSRVPDREKLHSNPSRVFGITNRVWLIVVIVLATILLLHNFLPGRSSSALPSYASNNLHPKNYLNSSSWSSPPPNPFPFCPSNGPSDTLAAKYGPALHSRTRNFQGTGYRVQRVLKRALSGQPVTISVIGGSISACHGAGDNPISPKCYVSKFFDWWNVVFPHPATEITNGAMRRTNSDYFGFCSAHHLPDVTDLVIVELDSDDTPDSEKTTNFEYLIRSLLTRPDQPAVIILGHFSPQVFQTWGLTGPDHWHSIVANHYDVPHLSAKPLLYDDYVEDPDAIKKKYYADAILANPNGHTLLSDVLIAYFQSMTCQLWNVVSGEEYDSVTGATKEKPGGGGLFGGIGLRKGVPEPKAAGAPKADGNNNDDSSSDSADTDRTKPKSPTSDPHLKVPQSFVSLPRSSSHRASGNFDELSPHCVSANDLINPLPPSLFYGSGWQIYHPSTSHASSRHDGLEGGATAAHYFYSTLPLSRIRIPIVVAHGDVGVYYLKEDFSRSSGRGSEIECWVDDNYNGRRKLANESLRKRVEVTLTLIDRFVAQGSHYVECQLLGEEDKGVPMFKIVAIFAN